jgi:cytochrome P450
VIHKNKPRWAVLRLAVDPSAQARLHADLVRTRSESGDADGKAFGPLFLAAAAACARDCPVSAAVGPPRKLTANVEFHGYALPAEAICFAMHPGLRAAAAAGTAPWSQNASRNLSGVSGGAAAADAAAWAWPLVLDGAVGSWPMFGAGPRACPASEQSLNFLAAAIAALVESFKWELASPVESAGAGAAAAARAVFAYSEDGSLLVPAADTPLKFTRR